MTEMHYLSIPVSNGLMDYEEYYSIARDLAESSDSHLIELRALAAKCRAHQIDDRLLQQLRSNRGTPV